MELNRLKRAIGYFHQSEDIYGDTKLLLDAIDMGHEEFETHEQSLASEYGELDRSLLLVSFNKVTAQLAAMLCDLEGYGTYEVLEVVLKRLGADTVIQEAKKYQEKHEHSYGDDSLGDLDDHPF